jgi:alkaline phosphatase
VLGLPKTYQATQYYRGYPTPNNSDLPYQVPFTPNIPTLAEMAKGALNVLDNDRDGFFLMIEGGAVDWAAHFWQPGRMIEEQIDFNKAVEAVVDWVNKKSNWRDTLLIITADHETGYLWGPGSNPTFEKIVNNGKNDMPGMQYYSDIGGFSWHSNSLVPLYAMGDGAKYFRWYANEWDRVRGRYLDNTEIFAVMKKCLTGWDHHFPFWGKFDASQFGISFFEAIVPEDNDGLGIPGH